MKKIEDLVLPIVKIHHRIRNKVVQACEKNSLEQMAEIHHESESDTIYSIDRISEDLIVEYFEKEIGKFTPIILIAEGIEGGKIMIPSNADEAEAKWRVIVDPIDGTRGLMYQKRSAWILTGVAPNKGETTGLQDIVLAVQTEIPLVKQHLSDSIRAIRGKGVTAERYNRLTGESTPLQLLPSRARTIYHGFAMISRFFPGAREVLAEIDEEIVQEALGPVQKGKTHCFEDQYVSTGGQLYELMAGHDRFNADLRPLMEKVLAKRGLALGICCHPYDICTELIASELGIIITDEKGNPINAPLNITEDICWVGYANPEIRAQLEPILQNALRKRGLIE